MKVRQLLHKLNPSQSTIQQVEVRNVKTGELAYYRDELLSENFGAAGELKVNSITIKDSTLLLYVE